MNRLLGDKNYVKHALTYKIFVCKKDFAEFTGRLGFVLSSYDSRLLHRYCTMGFNSFLSSSILIFINNLFLKLPFACGINGSWSMYLNVCQKLLIRVEK